MSNSTISSYVEFYIKSCPFFANDLQVSTQLILCENLYQAQAQRSGCIDIESIRQSCAIIAYSQVDPTFFLPSL
jgi:hypothetical protein